MKKLFMLGLLCSLLINCASVGRKIDQSAVEKIKKGETTKAQVIQLIGSPDQITKIDGNSTTFTYMFTRVTTKPTTFIPYVGLLAGGADTQNQMLMITFGPDDIVNNIVDSHGADEINTGLLTGSKAKMDDVEKNKRPK